MMSQKKLDKNKTNIPFIYYLFICLNLGNTIFKNICSEKSRNYEKLLFFFLDNQKLTFKSARTYFCKL